MTFKNKVASKERQSIQFLTQEINFKKVEELLKAMSLAHPIKIKILPHLTFQKCDGTNSVFIKLQKKRIRQKLDSICIFKNNNTKSNLQCSTEK